jgi:uncharacterized coiled-coil DUF342 family protein
LVETDKKGELLKRIEAEATGLDGKINDRDLSVSIDVVRNSLGEAYREITNNLKMADRLRKDAGEDIWHKECHRLFDEWYQKWF